MPTKAVTRAQIHLLSHKVHFCTMKFTIATYQETKERQFISHLYKKRFSKLLRIATVHWPQTSHLERTRICSRS